MRACVDHYDSVALTLLKNEHVVTQIPENCVHLNTESAKLYWKADLLADNKACAFMAD